VSPSLLITCGTEPKRGSATPLDVVSHFFGALAQPFGFFKPSKGLLSELNLSRGVYSLLTSSDHLEFESVQHLAQALSDLDSIAIALNHMDSEEFAIWSGLGKSDARIHLLQLVYEMQQVRIRAQGAQLQLDFTQNLPSTKALFRSLTQLALVGVACDSRQLQRAWSTSNRESLSKKWASKYESIRVFSASGVLLEREGLKFVFRVKWNGVGACKPAVGLVRNQLVVDVGGVRRFLELPAACSRMEPGSVLLSKNKFEIDFAVKESEWPRS
jgi:hypothetical protein